MSAAENLLFHVNDLRTCVHLQRIFAWKYYDHEYLSVEF